MFRTLIKFIPPLTFWGIFVLVVLQIPYPGSLTQASLLQFILFFMSLFLALVFTQNIFIKNIFISSAISLGLISLLILKALESVNLVTGGLVAISAGLLISYFRKNKEKDLTKDSKIPKLTNMRRKKI